MTTSKQANQIGDKMKIFFICFAVIVASIVSGVAGAIGVSVGVILANAYHAFD